jgi:ferredoxin
MCNFCLQHGDGKRWYLNAKNYAADLSSDLRRRGYMVGFVRGFEQNRLAIRAGLAGLRWVPEPIREPIAGAVSARLQEDHFGQPVPLEQCARIFSMATHITRLPCVCRGAMQEGSNAESCCIAMTVNPDGGVLEECFRDYAGGPESEGFQKLTREEALAYLRRAEARGLCHTVWTFKTPFVAAICNCDLPSGCMAMRLQLEGRVRIMWRGEDVVRRDLDRCNHCAECVARCPFGAIREVPGDRVELDRERCWGCGTCRSACGQGALRLEPRAAAADVAHLW